MTVASHLFVLSSFLAIFIKSINLQYRSSQVHLNLTERSKIVSITVHFAFNIIQMWQKKCALFFNYPSYPTGLTNFKSSCELCHMNSALCPPSNILSKKNAAAASLCNFLQWCCYWTVLLENQLHTIIFYYISLLLITVCHFFPRLKLLRSYYLVCGVCVCQCVCVFVCVCVCVCVCVWCAWCVCVCVCCVCVCVCVVPVCVWVCVCVCVCLCVCCVVCVCVCGVCVVCVCVCVCGVCLCVSECVCVACVLSEWGWVVYLRKSSRGRVEEGMPWAGQLSKWNWVRVRVSWVWTFFR